MTKKEKNEELQSRREFFKSAAKGALPILAFTMLGSSTLTSCGDDKPSTKTGSSSNSSGCGSNCSGGCKSSCSGDCDGGCTNNCDSLCGGDCWAYCESKAKS